MKRDVEKMSDADLMAEWTEKINSGYGWGPGEEGQSPEDAAIAEGYEIVKHLGDWGTPAYEMVLAKKNDSYIVVADSNGPWAQDID